MKAVLGVGFLAFCAAMGIGRPAEAAWIVKSQPTGDQSQHVSETIRVTTDSTTLVDLMGMHIRYYFYQGVLPVGWASMTPPSGTTISVKRIGTVTAANGKNANFYVDVDVVQSKMVSSAQPFDFSFSLGTSPISSVTQTDDWSYANNTSLQTNANIEMFNDNSGHVAYGNAPVMDYPTQLALAKQKIKHVIIIMQENNSFDHLFGTFPNAEGVASAPLAQPLDCDGTMLTFPYIALTDTVQPNKAGGATAPSDVPHMMDNAKADLGCPSTPISSKTCDISNLNPNTLNPNDFLNTALAYSQQQVGHCDAAYMQGIVGHYDASTISNYWQLAYTFALQDHMFAPAPSYSRVTHLYMVSGWSATCPTGISSCTENMQEPGFYAGKYAWKDITSLLDTAPKTSWGYFKGEYWSPNCSTCSTSPLSCFNSGDVMPVDFWEPLSKFQTVSDNQSLSKIQELQPTDAAHPGFYTDIAGQSDANVPAVSWIVPGMQVSDHPGTGVDLKHGAAYVMTLVQQIMKNTALWNSSVIYVAWDDWGGYYDHVRPPRDRSGNLKFGIRVPGIAISPWIHSAGYVDKNIYSFDSYLRFIEDVFRSGTRISGDPRPSPGRDVGEDTGNLLDEFDFHRTPISTTNILNQPCSAP